MVPKEFELSAFCCRVKQVILLKGHQQCRDMACTKLEMILTIHRSSILYIFLLPFCVILTPYHHGVNQFVYD